MVDYLTQISDWITNIGPLHWQSPTLAITLMLSYVVFESFLQYRYYYRQRDRPQDWKVAPTKTNSLAHSHTWWLPILSYWTTKERAQWHWLFATINVAWSGLFQCFLCEAILRGSTKIYWDYNEHSWWLHALGFVVPHVYQGLLEYYWHIGLHWGPLYRTFHKIHHYYKHPEPFDAMFIHPLESFGYYCILFSPPFFIPMHLHAWLLYMVINGLTGMLDHSGIKFRVPNVYDTADHDAHHSKFECNYAFPFPYLDILNGTYLGSMSFFGKEYHFYPSNWAKLQKLE